MNAAPILRLALWDVRVQARERIYLFTVFTTAFFVATVALLPSDAPVTVITAILFLDPAVVGMGFVAARPRWAMCPEPDSGRRCGRPRTRLKCGTVS